MSPQFNHLRKHRLLAEPLFHFLIAGAAIFVGFAAMEEPQDKADVIIVTDADVALIEGQYRQTWKAEPTKDQLAALVDGFVRDEVLYREALALGLDRGDSVIRQRLGQKLEFILEAAQDIPTPGEAELQAWFAAHGADYAPSLKLQFEQVLLQEQGDADSLRATLAAGADPTTVGRATQLPLSARALDVAVDASFGPGFSAAIAGLPEGEWAGPVQSSYGWHLVKVIAISRDAGSLEAQREKVEADWRRNALESRIDPIVAAMRDIYEIRLPEGMAE